MSRTARCSRQAVVDPSGEAPPDARHFAQALRLALDHLEHLVAERRDQLLGHGAADALDHARAEIRLDASSVFGGTATMVRARNCRP